MSQGNAASFLYLFKRSGFVGLDRESSERAKGGGEGGSSKGKAVHVISWIERSRSLAPMTSTMQLACQKSEEGGKSQKTDLATIFLYNSRDAAGFPSSSRQ